MQRFIDGDLDVLVATTIIENGIDIPNVNTMIVNDADRFGLAQLYQLRGRVGRSNHQAYCYLLYQGHKALSEEAKARLEAIREFAHLGSGLQIAMRDLEIRGAGNLLGSAQSGFIASVGFDTYCEILAQAIARAARRSNCARGPARSGHRREDRCLHSQRLHRPSLPEDRRLSAASKGSHARRGRGGRGRGTRSLRSVSAAARQPRGAHEASRGRAAKARHAGRGGRTAADAGRGDRLLARPGSGAEAAVADEESLPLLRGADSRRSAPTAKIGCPSCAGFSKRSEMPAGLPVIGGTSARRANQAARDRGALGPVSLRTEIQRSNNVESPTPHRRPGRPSVGHVLSGVLGWRRGRDGERSNRSAKPRSTRGCRPRRWHVPCCSRWCKTC